MFLALFLTVSCQEDLYNLEKKGTQKIRNISFNELKNRVSQKKLSSKGTVSILDKVTSKLLAKSSEEFIQEVDTTKIIEIQKDGFSTFTLNIVTTDQDLRNLYNLVIVERDNEYKEILLKYHSNSTTIITPENFSGTVTAINQDGTATTMDIENYDKMVYVECGNEIQIICMCSQNNAHCGGESNVDCPSQSGQVIGIVIQPTYCLVSDGGVGGGDGGISAPSTPSTPASPNNNNSGSNGINTTPNGGSNPNLSQVKVYIRTLTTAQQNAYNQQNTNGQAAVNNLLIETNFSLQSTNFIKSILDKINLSPNDEITSVIPFFIEKNIDDTQLDPCSKSVLNVIKNSTNLDFAKIIAKLDNPKNTYLLRIKTESFIPANNNETVTAETKYTNPIVKFDYTIRLRQKYINGEIDLEPNSPPTQLSIASNIIHEFVHAYFLSIIDDQATTNPDALSNYQLLFDAFVTKKLGTSYSAAQHESMATLYHDIIAAALQEFHTGQVISNPAQITQVYSDLAWAGLHETNIYNDPNGPLTDIDRTRIQNRKRAEERNQPKGDQSPIGTPCN